MRIFARGWSEGFDGPGRRLVYYLKGCNFRCLWCGNPESIAAEPELLFYPEKSAFAAQACPRGAVRGESLDRGACARCINRPCVSEWRDRAFELAGKEISAAEIVDEAQSRRAMLGKDGGVTFSGGEPSLQMDALLEAAAALREKGIAVAVETNASSPRFHELSGRFDTIICDLKCVSAELHRRITGADNRGALANLSSGSGINLRIPLIRELNFTAEERERIFQFLLRSRPDTVGFLRLHRLGLPKYKALGLSCEAESLTPPERLDVEVYCLRLKEEGIAAEVLN
jgi:pyruvate formate lyase activating enzyme